MPDLPGDADFREEHRTVHKVTDAQARRIQAVVRVVVPLPGFDVVSAGEQGTEPAAKS